MEFKFKFNTVCSALLFVWIIQSNSNIINCADMPGQCMTEQTVWRTDLSALFPCTMLNTKSNLQCAYQRTPTNTTLPAESECEFNYPGRPTDVRLSTYKFSYDGAGSHTALNISWRLPQDGGSFQYITGFQLNITDGTDTWKRTFYLSCSPHQVQANFETVFYYDCFNIDDNQQYEISLQSLPIYNGFRVPNLNVTHLLNIITVTTGQGTVPANCSSDSWTANAIVSPFSSSNPDKSSIIISFTAAPACYNFTGYRIVLTDPKSRVMNVPVQSRVVNTRNGLVYVEFTNVCPMVYNVQIIPIGDICSRPLSDGNFCTMTPLPPINMNQTSCTNVTQKPYPDCPTPSTRSIVISTPAAVVESTTQPSEPHPTPQIIIIIVVSVIGAIIAVAIPFIVCKIRKRPTVLLIHSTDNEAHVDVVKHIAKFLKVHTGCNVLLERSDAGLTLLEWVSQQLRHADYVIVIHSEKSWGFMRDYFPTADINISVSDTFQALCVLWSNQKVDRDCQLVKVYLPYCPATRFVGFQNVFYSKNKFELMKEITDLVELLCESRVVFGGPRNAKLIAGSIEYLSLRDAIAKCSPEEEDNYSVILQIGVPNGSFIPPMDVEGSVNTDDFLRIAGKFMPEIQFVGPQLDGDGESITTEVFEQRVKALNIAFDNNMQCSGLHQ